MDLQAPSEKVY